MTRLATLLVALAIAPSGARADEAYFESKVRPVLVERCVKCHGAAKSSGELRLDSAEALRKGGESGAAVVPGKPAESLLVKAVRRHKGVEAMPPDKPLPESSVIALEKWVADGAAWPARAAPLAIAKHWAFEPIRKPDSTTTIDAFVNSKLTAKSLKPVGRADKPTLIRRATFDLTGLPPTPEEIDAFLKDDSPDAFGKTVERLLASPHYGEKWGRHWLDVVRYADTAGETGDFPAPEAWRYRNYVIDSYNADVPFDRFVREQVAGDIMAAQQQATISPRRYAELQTATGYLAVARRFGFDVRADHYLTIEDTIDTLGKSILGLTIACARCHDHKYDPVTAKDYYALYGIFASTRYPLPGCEKMPRPADLVPMTSPSRASLMRQALSGLTGPAATAVQSYSVGPFAYAVAEGTPSDAKLHKRGEPTMPGDVVPRRFPSVLGGQVLPPDSGSGRLALAGWLTDANDPLTARVMANRVWQGHFGTGIVATPSDFGTRGAPPTHPEMLDYLAGEFVAHGWSVKWLHRTIMASEAYQRSTATDPHNATVDADDTWLWRFPRRRLSAEEIRDTLLIVSGDLDLTPGTAHPFPPPNSWGFTQHAPFAAVYDTNKRSVYLMTQRLKRHPFLALFDGPDTNASTAERRATTVPTQALWFLNDPFVHACAQKLATRLTGSPEEGRLDHACRLLYGRPAGEADIRVANKFVAGPFDSPAERRHAWASLLRVMFAGNEFVYVD